MVATNAIKPRNVPMVAATTTPTNFLIEVFIIESP